MQAAYLSSCRTFTLCATEKPQLQPDKPGTLLVKTAFSAVCGSDLPRFRLQSDTFPKRPGQPMHECIGTVEESQSSQFKIGELVLAIPEDNTGLAEYFISAENKAIHLPNGPLHAEHVLAQPLGTVISALRRLDSVIGKTVLILGQGPIGLMFTQMLAHMGARHVIAVEPVNARRGIAKRMFATHLIDPDREDTAQIVAEITGGDMADVVVEAVGHQPHTLNDAIGLTRHRGTLLAFGVPDEPTYPVRFNNLFRRNITLVGCVGPYPVTDFSMALDLITQQRFNTEGLLSHRMHFSRAQEAFELAISREDGVIKILLEYND